MQRQNQQSIISLKICIYVPKQHIYIVQRGRLKSRKMMMVNNFHMLLMVFNGFLYFIFAFFLIFISELNEMQFPYFCQNTQTHKKRTLFYTLTHFVPISPSEPFYHHIEFNVQRKTHMRNENPFFVWLLKLHIQLLSEKALRACWVLFVLFDRSIISRRMADVVRKHHFFKEKKHARL